MAASSSDAQGPVWFWGMDGTPEQVLNQWYPCKFEDEDKIEYSSTEEYMMYHKAILFGDKETAQRILDSNDPRQQKGLGREVRNFVPKTWDSQKFAIVEKANYLKFTQSTEMDSDKLLREFLLGTGNRELVEASPYDRIWGIGYRAKDAPRTPRSKWGQNLLGKVLMAVRDRIRSESSAAS